MRHPLFDNPWFQQLVIDSRYPNDLYHRWLYQHVQRVAEPSEATVIVELGTYMGSTAITMAAASGNISVRSIDNYTEISRFQAAANVVRFGVSRQVLLIEVDGLHHLKNAPGRLDILHLDADHSESFTKEALEVCIDRHPECQIIVHDYRDPDVRKAVDAGDWYTVDFNPHVPNGVVVLRGPGGK